MEFWDVYDENGEKTGKQISDHSELKSGELHLAIEAWIRDSQGRFLIQKRSRFCKTLPGMWAHTTGRIQAGEDSAQGCIREVAEELGIAADLHQIRFLRRIICEDSPLFWDLYLIDKDVLIEQLVLDEQEVEAVKWISLKELLESIQSGTFVHYPEIFEILSQIESM